MNEDAPISRVSAADVSIAERLVAPYTRRTPILEVEPGAVAPGPVTLKLELFQHTGSFKPRGMFNALLSAPVPRSGIVAASGGNAGLAAAFAARTLGHRAEIFVPTTAPTAKVAGLYRLGATVYQVGLSYADALEASRVRSRETGALEVHAYDQHAVVAGQGTVAIELDVQVPSIDTVLVAVGGGGLIGGIAAWFGERVRVIGVETERCRTLGRALEAGSPVDIEVGGIAADALGARRIGELCWAGRDLISSCVTVTDEAVISTQRLLWSRLRLVAEPGGATALAALVARLYLPAPDERVAVVVCGGNTDPGSVAPLTAGE